MGGLDDFQTFTVTVNEVNAAPVLEPIGTQAALVDTLLSFMVTATDTDLPNQTSRVCATSTPLEPIQVVLSARHLRVHLKT